MQKQWYQSKKLWSGVIILISGVTAILTGEKALDGNTISEFVLTIFGLFQTILAIKEGNPVAFGGKVFGNKS